MSNIHTDLSTVQVSVAPSPATTGTSLGVTDAQAALLPDVYPFWALVRPVNAKPTRANSEIVKVTGGSSSGGTTTYTIVRTQGIPVTTARSIIVGDDISEVHTAQKQIDTETTASGSDINTGTDVLKKVTPKAIADSILKNSPQGFLLNGKIIPSVANNDLTVAIKGLDGNDASATNPIYIRIGDTVRSITAALSVTKNDATNWFNAGSAELATKQIDYFVYLGYNATDGVVIGFSRIPYAKEYSEFSTTSTNEKYCAISTITNAAAGDDYENIGRFAATLSAGAGYTWTVPTFTNINLVQRPIYNTRFLDITAVTSYSGGTSDPATPLTWTNQYQVNNRNCFTSFFGATTNGSGGRTTLVLNLPFTLAGARCSGGVYDSNTIPKIRTLSNNLRLEGISPGTGAWEIIGSTNYQI